MTKETEVENNAHHKYSPSKLETYERCPCFEQDNSKPNEAAEAGTRQHEALETGDLSKLLDRWEHDRVLEGQMVEQNLQAEFPNAKVVKELYVEGIFNHGSSDFNLLDFEAGVAVVLDWKFGQIAVAPVDRNLQIWNYVLNVFTMYPEIHTIHGCIFQPKVDGGIQRHEFPRSMIPEIENRIRRVIARREDPNRQSTPDSKACLYCNQKAKCKPWAKTGVVALNEEYGFTLPRNFLTCLDVPAEELAARYQAYAFLEEMGKLGKKATNVRWENIRDITGVEAPGLKHVVRKGTLTCIDVAKAALLRHQIGEAKFFEDCMSLKPAQLVKLLSEATGEPSEDIVNRFIEQGIFKRGAESRFVQVTGKKKTAAIAALKEAK